MTDLGYITLGSREFVRADDWTKEQQELRETGVVPRSKRIVTAAEQARAEFWRLVEQRARRIAVLCCEGWCDHG